MFPKNIETFPKLNFYMLKLYMQIFNILAGWLR